MEKINKKDLTKKLVKKILSRDSLCEDSAWDLGNNIIAKYLKVNPWDYEKEISCLGDSFPYEVYKLGNFLHKNNVPVPKNYGLLKLKKSALMPHYSGHPFEEGKFLLREKVPGDTLYNLLGEDKILNRKIINQVKTELKKILNLGIYPDDIVNNGTNTVFNPENEKIYFIDYKRWRKLTDKEKWFENHLKDPEWYLDLNGCPPCFTPVKDIEL